MNYGVDGYGQVQELLLLDEIFQDVQPKVVVLLIYVRNDFDDNLGELDWIRRYARPRCQLSDDGQLRIDARVLHPKPVQVERFVDQVLDSTRILNLLVGSYRELFVNRNFDAIPIHRQPSELRYCRKRTGVIEDRSFKITKNLLEMMQAKCSDHTCTLCNSGSAYSLASLFSFVG